MGNRLKHNLLALTIISLFCAAMGIALTVMDGAQFYRVVKGKCSKRVVNAL